MVLPIIPNKTERGPRAQSDLIGPGDVHRDLKTDDTTRAEQGKLRDGENTVEVFFSSLLFIFVWFLFFLPLW